MSYREEGLYHRGQSSSAGGRLVCSLWRVLSCVSLDGECEGWKGRPCLALTTCILHDDLEGGLRDKLGPSPQSCVHLDQELEELQVLQLPHAHKLGQQGGDSVCGWEQNKMAALHLCLPNFPNAHMVLLWPMLTQDPRGKGILGSVATWVQHKITMIACTADSLSFHFSAPPQTGGRRFSVAPSFGLACEGCPTGRQRSGGLHSRISFSHGSGGWKSNVRVSAGLVS